MVQPLTPQGLNNQKAPEEDIRKRIVSDHSIMVLSLIKKEGVTNPFALAFVDFTLGTFICLVERISCVVLSIILVPYFMYLDFSEKKITNGIFKFMLPLGCAILAITNVASHVFFGSEGYMLGRNIPENQQILERILELKSDFEKLADLEKEQKQKILNKLQTIEKNNLWRLEVGNHLFICSYMKLQELYSLKVDAIKENNEELVKKISQKITGHSMQINQFVEAITDREFETLSEDNFEKLIESYNHLIDSDIELDAQKEKRLKADEKENARYIEAINEDIDKLRIYRNKQTTLKGKALFDRDIRFLKEKLKKYKVS